MRTALRRGVFLCIGAAGGFAYYYFIGCASGACPITSNPYVSTAYGAFIGLILGGGKPKKQESRDPGGITPDSRDASGHS